MTDEMVREKLLFAINENKITHDKVKLDEVLDYAKSIYKDELRYTGQSYFEHSARSCY